MAIQAPDPDFGQIKCPNCDIIMKPVSLPKKKDRTAKVLECPKCGRKITEPAK
jgi:ribosomal protein S27E